MDRTDLGQGREENIRNKFKQIEEFGAVYLRYLSDIQAERPCRQLDHRLSSGERRFGDTHLSGIGMYVALKANGPQEIIRAASRDKRRQARNEPQDH